MPEARVRVKICGLTRVEDVQAAVQAGADALGFVFYAPSPRAVDVQQAAALVAAVPPFVTTVGLFVNPSADRVWEVLDAVPLDLLQFHGGEAGDFCSQFHRPYMKAMRLGGPDSSSENDLKLLMRDHADAQGFLLDRYDPNQFGGTGETFDWRICSNLSSTVNQPRALILAGGLSPNNVGQAIAQVKPYAVDVSSGVEGRKKGEKDAGLMRAFLHAVETGST